MFVSRVPVVKNRVFETREVKLEEVKDMAVVTMKQLLEAGVHFGHQTRRWNLKWLLTSLRIVTAYTSLIYRKP